jgi:hypothetical protein
MNDAKRHHWWPQVQSNFWTQSDGLICVTKPDGTSFRTIPENVAVVGKLHTRTDRSGNSDIEIENWFSNNIESPFKTAAQYFDQLKSVIKIKVMGRHSSSKIAEMNT